MADLNDDIKKYLNGELTPAEMHALEKRALSDPFLYDALEGASQIGHNDFRSDLSKLKSSLEDRISKKSEKVVSMWGWTMRVAAGLTLIALSTFVIVRFSGNKSDNDLALKQESVEPGKDEASEGSSLPDSTKTIEDVTPGIAAVEAEPQTATPNAPKSSADKDQHLQIAEKSATSASGAAASTETARNGEAEVKEQERIADATESIPAEQPAQVETTTESEEAKRARQDVATANVPYEQRQSGLAKTLPDTKASPPQRLAVASKVITGRVESTDGIGLPGVNVMLKNTNIGTVTDGSGNYKLTTSEQNPDLVFSFIGFTSTEVAAGDKTQVDVQLEEDVSQLSEVVVVGYGSEKKDEEMETVELASPNGGRRAFKQYLEKNLRYPEQALASGVEGKVTILFTVETTGQLSDFKVIKGIGHGCEEEVIRLVKQGPKWYPTRRNTEATRDKVKVRMKFTLPKK